MTISKAAKFMISATTEVAGSPSSSNPFGSAEKTYHKAIPIVAYARASLKMLQYLRVQPTLLALTNSFVLEILVPSASNK